MLKTKMNNTLSLALPSNENSVGDVNNNNSKVLKSRMSNSAWDKDNLASLTFNSALGHRSPLGHKRGVTSLSYCEKSATLFSGSHDTVIKVWSLDKETDRFQCVRTLEGHKFTVWALCATKDGKYLFSGSSDGNIIVRTFFHCILISF